METSNSENLKNLVCSSILHIWVNTSDLVFAPICQVFVLSCVDYLIIVPLSLLNAFPMIFESILFVILIKL